MWPLEKPTKIGFQYRLSLNAGQRYCRLLQGEHSAILQPSLSYRFPLRPLFCLFFKWPLKTGFTIYAKSADIDQSDQWPHYLLSEYKLLKMGKSIHLKGANIAFMVAKGQGSE